VALDVWVGEVGDYAGTATNDGIVEVSRGNFWMAGRSINQLGGVESSTSVALNRADRLQASYGAVSNPRYDATIPSMAGRFSRSSPALSRWALKVSCGFFRKRKATRRSLLADPSHSPPN
jgi:hypothetical protein